MITCIGNMTVQISQENGSLIIKCTPDEKPKQEKLSPKELSTIQEAHSRDISNGAPKFLRKIMD